jgi:hypothetical protein
MRARLPRETDSAFEALLAELTDAAYRTALGHGLHGSFIDTELALWRELRQVLQTRWQADAEQSRLATWSSWRGPVDDEILAGSR